MMDCRLPKYIIFCRLKGRSFTVQIKKAVDIGTGAFACGDIITTLALLCNNHSVPIASVQLAIAVYVRDLKPDRL